MTVAGNPNQMKKSRGKGFVSSAYLSEVQLNVLDSLIRSLAQNSEVVRRYANFTFWTPIFIMATPRGVYVNSSYGYPNGDHIKWNDLGLSIDAIREILGVFTEVCMKYDSHDSKWFCIKVNHETWVDIRSIMAI